MSPTMLALVAMLLLADTPDAGASTAPPRGASCQTVRDCWLAPDGTAIARPRKFKGRKLPRPNCENNLLWLRFELSCTANVCTSKFVGDEC